ncbi:hypothetical protein ES707_06746 [subsurface metagenome]
MSKNLEALEKLQIPGEQIGRQAVDSLRGYVYQIYQSLASWIGIEEDEVLLLEVAEDFAVLAEGALTATQVKDTGASVTLRTKSVSDTIKALWDFQDANTNKSVYLNYLTTAKIGKEKKLTFPDGLGGLTYWRVAAREGADVEPLRQELLNLRLPSKIKSFIKSATPEKLRDKLLRRIKWICGTEDIKVLEKTILDQLICIGEEPHLTLSDAERVRDSLVAEILRTIVKESNRRLNRADFLRVFDKSSSVSVPISSVRKCMEAMSVIAGQFSGDLVSATGLVMTVSEIPLPARIVDRNKLVTGLFAEMGQSGVLWLHGSSGVGKTVLAQFVARRSKREWLLVQLRDCSSDDLGYRLHRALEGISSGNIGGVILDDFPTKHAHTSRLRLSMLVSEVHRMDGAVLFTASKPPSPNLQNCFGGDCPLVVDAPYLSQEEVAELVESAGGDPTIWAPVIHTFCGFGHPQLVQARISGLKQRNWPKKELLAGIDPSRGAAQEIDSERDSIRERLISELSDRTRELLCRLTLVVGYFDRELAIALGQVAPAIQRPGEALDMLLGPWIEIRASDRFKISPLVSDAGTKSLGKDTQLEIHKRIVDQLLTRHPFPADFLGQLLGHAMCARHEPGLTWLAMAVMNTPVEHRKMMSDQLFLLPLLGSDEKKILFQENTYLSALLRIAQFNVATWGNMTDRLPMISERLIGEVRTLDNEEIRASFLPLAIIVVLMEQVLTISPKNWIPLLAELEEALSGEGEVAKLVRSREPVKNGVVDLPLPQFLFAVRASSLRSINEQGELFSELDNMEPKRRTKLLSSLNEIPSGNRLMIDSAWLGESRAGKMDGIATAEKYRRLAEIAESWGEKGIAVECEYARCVMLDEYADDSEGALVALDEAEKKFPNSFRLARQRAKVYYRSGNYPAALTTIENFAKDIPKEDYTEKTFALREAGISAAETEDFAKASSFFSEAYEAASAASINILPMAIGLKGDRAVVEFQLGHKSEALNLMQQALIEAEQLNPEAGKNEKYCTLILGHIILWMQTQVKDGHLSEKDFKIIPGCCSNPDPSEKIMERQSQPMLVYWYHLAVLEVMLRVNSGIMDELRARTCTQRIKSCELVLNRYLMEKYIISVDIDNFFSYLPEYIVKAAHMREHLKNVQAENIYDFMSDDFPLFNPDDWKSEDNLYMAKDAILALAAIAVCSHVSNFNETLQNHIERMEHASNALKPLIECFKKKPSQTGNAYDMTASCLGRLMGKEVFVNPDDMFIITFRLWAWLSQSTFKLEVENMLADYFVESWRDIIKNQSFLLKQPMISVPAIEVALKEPTRGTVKITAIVVATENAVKHRLDDKLRAKLKNECIDRPKIPPQETGQ